VFGEQVKGLGSFALSNLLDIAVYELLQLTLGRVDGALPGLI
jgi:hypothetical protein